MLRAIWIQVRIIAALTLRETRMTFGTSYAGYLWAIAQPLFSILILVGIFYLIGRQAPYGSSLALFFATAALTLSLFNKLSSSLMRAITSNKSLLNYPMIKETDTMFARLLLISLTFIVINVIFYGGLISLGLASFPAHPEKVVFAFMGTCFLGFGIGALNAAIFQHNDNWKHVQQLLARPLFLLSGVFYVPSNLPPQAIAVLRWNPVLHLVELNREGYYAHYQSDILQVSYPMFFAAFLLMFGLFLERFTRKQRA